MGKTQRISRGGVGWIGSALHTHVSQMQQVGCAIARYLAALLDNFPRIVVPRPPEAETETEGILPLSHPSSFEQKLLDDDQEHANFLDQHR